MQFRRLTKTQITRGVNTHDKVRTWLKTALRGSNFEVMRRRV